MITFQVDCATEKEFKTEYTQNTEKALMDMLTTSHAVAANNLEDAFYSCIKNMLTEMALKGTMDENFMNNLDW